MSLFNLKFLEAMKKIVYTIILLLVASGCNDDFLERYPLSEVSPQTYFKTENELETYINSLYSYLPTTSIFQDDTQSDNLAPKAFNQVVAGQHQVETDAGPAGWTWGYLRDVNFFLENYSRAQVEPAVKNHYAGIARFFRAWSYFDKVKRFGEVPWYGESIGNTETELLYKARDSRVLVMDSVMADLDFASENIYDNTPANTINKWAALALKARVGLHEGTFRKYHNLQGGEVFLQAAVEAAEEIMNSGLYDLYSTGNPKRDYLDLFVKEVADPKEVILATVFDAGFNAFHTANGTFLTGTLLAPGLTKSLVNTYLMTDGTPFTNQPGYQTMAFVEEVQNRDPRLAQTIRTPGYTRIGSSLTLAPNFDNARTGYQNIKFVMSEAFDGFNQNTNDLPIFRYAEVLLNYAEAKAELGNLDQVDLDRSVNLIRTRVDMPALQLGGIAVDPVLQNRYPNVSGAQQAAILEIRRERRVELAIEGFRYDDLMRWKAGDLLTKTFKGMYIPGSDPYDVDDDGQNDIALVESIPGDQAQDVQYLQLGDGFDLEEGNRGNIRMHPTVSKTFNDPQHYYFPLPRTELLLNDNLTQNLGW